MSSSPVLIYLTLLVLGTPGIWSYSRGPPSSICVSLTPQHGVPSQSGNGDYVISIPSSLTPDSSGDGFTYQPGTAYTVRIEKTSDSIVDFKGFAIQAVEGGTTNVLGQFGTPATNQKYLTCSGNTQATITHSLNVFRSSEEFTWTSPADTPGSVDFRYTVVRQYSTFFAANLASGNNYVVVTTEPTDTPTSAAIKTEPTTSEAKATNIVTDGPDTNPPNTDAPETNPPNTDSSDTDPPNTDAADTDPPIIDAPDTNPPNTDDPFTEPPIINDFTGSDSPTNPPNTDGPDTSMMGSDGSTTESQARGIFHCWYLELAIIFLTLLSIHDDF